jgi:serine/threonine protein kinase/Flp pilus assembly protein TadD
MNSADTPTALPSIGHYQLLDCIGRGGMGLVYRARDTRLGREVAIKCLRTELFEAHYRERFRREALLLAKLNHPHIVHIYDFIETDDQLALVMELIDGQNLQTHLREQVVPTSQRVTWLIQIAQGLAVAHDAGIIHRDLKAENVLINHRKEAKISDLGIAKSQDFNATLTDHVAGSYASMSPEQAMGEVLDFKSDLFSFGILAYQLLCGAHPFGECDNKLQLMQRIISHPPIPPTKFNASLPPEICTLLGQLLSKNPDKRPDSARWIASQLEKLAPRMVESNFENNDTQILGATLAGSAATTGRSAVKYIEHPTFNMGAGEKFSAQQTLAAFIKQNRRMLAIFSVALIVVVSLSIWLLQPNPPKYIAVAPPTLTANGMPDSQQEIVKGAVYDAIQQSILQLNGFYLIPRTEVIDVNGDAETIQKATAADEIITAHIHCKTDVCNLSLTQLVSDNNRLRVLRTRQVDLLTDNYLSMAEIIQKNVASWYSRKIENSLKVLSEADYSTFIHANEQYMAGGASEDILKNLGNLPVAAQNLSALQTLYRDVALDLFYETGESQYVEKLDTFLASKRPATETEKFAHLLNLYHFNIAKRDFATLPTIIDQLTEINVSDAKAIELNAVAALRKGEYETAAQLFTKAIKIKPTVNFYHNLALSNWYLGNTDDAIANLHNALAISPSHHKLHRLLGTISLYRGDIDSAIASFEKILTLRPQDTLSMMNLGLCYLLIKDYDKARGAFIAARKLAPDYMTLILNLADTYNLAGDSESAKALYQQILLQSNPIDDTSHLRNKAQAHAHLGDFNSAILTLQELQKSDPQGIDTNYSSALIYALAGDRTSAVVNTEAALKKDLHHSWFGFAWFDSLCESHQFANVMTQYGNPSRCSYHIEPETKIITEMDGQHQFRDLSTHK